MSASLNKKLPSFLLPVFLPSHLARRPDAERSRQRAVVVARQSDSGRRLAVPAGESQRAAEQRGLQVARPAARPRQGLRARPRPPQTPQLLRALLHRARQTRRRGSLPFYSTNNTLPSAWFGSILRGGAIELFQFFDLYNFVIITSSIYLFIYDGSSDRSFVVDKLNYFYFFDLYNFVIITSSIYLFTMGRRIDPSWWTHWAISISLTYITLLLLLVVFIYLRWVVGSILHGGPIWAISIFWLI